MRILSCSYELVHEFVHLGAAACANYSKKWLRPVIHQKLEWPACGKSPLTSGHMRSLVCNLYHIEAVLVLAFGKSLLTSGDMCSLVYDSYHIPSDLVHPPYLVSDSYDAPKHPTTCFQRLFKGSRS